MKGRGHVEDIQGAIMNDKDREGAISHPVIIAIIVVALGSGGLSGLLWAGAKGAFGKLGDVAVGWLLEHSTNSQDLEFQRALALGREAEAVRQSEFRRQEEREESKHKRDMELRRQAAREREVEGEKFVIPPARHVPIIIPRGACVLDGDNYRCNTDQGDYSTPVQGYDPTQRDGQYYDDKK